MACKRRITGASKTKRQRERQKGSYLLSRHKGEGAKERRITKENTTLKGKFAVEGKGRRSILLRKRRGAPRGRAIAAARRHLP